MKILLLDNLILRNWIWIIAFLFSLFWGIYGWAYVEKGEELKDKRLMEKIGDSLSEFAGSFIGWVFFYILVLRLQSFDKLGSFDIFLGTIAVIGICGYSFKLVDALKR